MNIIKIAVFFLSYVSATSCSIASTRDFNINSNLWELADILGRWSPNCEKIGGINIQDQNKITIEVNSNQIYILSTGTINNDTLIMTLNSPEDLGRGGMMLEWDNFSKETPIAKMELISERKSKVEWLGFYNNKLKTSVWLSEPDFLETESDIFYKCNDQ
jgi:hypothetical protein